MLINKKFIRKKQLRIKLIKLRFKTFLDQQNQKYFENINKNENVFDESESEDEKLIDENKIKKYLNKIDLLLNDQNISYYQRYKIIIKIFNFFKKFDNIENVILSKLLDLLENFISNNNYYLKIEYSLILIDFLYFLLFWDKNLTLLFNSKINSILINKVPDLKFNEVEYFYLLTSSIKFIEYNLYNNELFVKNILENLLNFYFQNNYNFQEINKDEIEDYILNILILILERYNDININNIIFENCINFINNSLTESNNLDKYYFKILNLYINKNNYDNIFNYEINDFKTIVLNNFEDFYYFLNNNNNNNDLIIKFINNLDIVKLFENIIIEKDLFDFLTKQQNMFLLILEFLIDNFNLDWYHENLNKFIIDNFETNNKELLSNTLKVINKLIPFYTLENLEELVNDSRFFEKMNFSIKNNYYFNDFNLFFNLIDNLIKLGQINNNISYEFISKKEEEFEILIKASNNWNSVNLKKNINIQSNDINLENIYRINNLEEFNFIEKYLLYFNELDGIKNAYELTFSKTQFNYLENFLIKINDLNNI